MMKVAFHKSMSEGQIEVIYRKTSKREALSLLQLIKESKTVFLDGSMYRYNENNLEIEEYKSTLNIYIMEV